MTGYSIRTQGLSVGYGGEPLIRDISIAIGKGEIVTLIGPNGAGKSTILRSIARQLRTLAGTVLIEGRDLPGISRGALARQMAVVLIDRLQPELMTCRDVVAAGRYPYTGRIGILSADDERRVEEALAAVNALDISEREFGRISDGQRQRVLLARALCQEPSIIILDEPTSFLDIRYKLELLEILRGMSREKGITVVLSLHEIDLAEKISDRILCVRGETIYRYGTPDEVFAEDTIRALYDVERGFFDPLFGSLELDRPQGPPEVFVISACGSGIPIYRALQRQNTAFCAGILYTNDVDYRLARLLATEVVAETPFMEISDETYARALSLLRACKRVVCADVPIGDGNRRMQSLIDDAKALFGETL
ncbi:ABC transporter ATP-binding protein [Eubacteriales bacterium OttesenSCG-928-A19]|nr:ABC transporter ATP-binding protein [Eubacteriales bacterium OttesenSCG-928-A19]